ncbi:MAG TPA: exosortase A [Casimicrobiaceae bacterium]|nr:exosortase A [Casimicrobiaceae bacterium]
MNGGTGQALSAPAAPSPLAATVDPRWRLALPLVVGAIVIILAIHWQTAESIVAIWARSETFAHGFLIVPIVLVLIWRQRHVLAGLRPSPDWLGLALLAGAGMVWLVAYAGEVLVIRQLALVAMLWGAVIALLGREVARALIFPLGFLVLGVPMGEALIPPLMEWTAEFTIRALQITGIPVYREGLFFTIPSGNWSIVEGCSGVRYLIASFTVGVLFAYLSYRRIWKRLLFAAMSIIVPIIANGFRAYLIVMIAHLSDNKLAHGIDHFIYGWVFFGLVMLLLFWIGSFWRDSEADTDVRTAASPLPAGAQPPQRRSLPGYAVAVLALVAVWPAYGAYLDRDDGDVPKTLELAAPAAAGGWIVDSAPLTEWRPRYDPASATVFQVYSKGDRLVAVYLAYYQHQRRGTQLVSSTNIMVVQKHPVWSNVGESRSRASVGPAMLEVRETKLRSPAQRLLIWDWFRIGEHDLINPYAAKWALAWQKLSNRGDDGTAIILATPYDDPNATPEETLREFVRAMMPSITSALARVKMDTVAGNAVDGAAQ